MDDNLGKAEQMVRKRKQRKRHVELLKLLDEILSGQIDNRKPDLNKMYSLHDSVRNQYQSGPRKEYTSPEDRSSYNYGYMTIDQMQAGTPNVW